MPLKNVYEIKCKYQIVIKYLYKRHTNEKLNDFRFLKNKKNNKKIGKEKAKKKNAII